MDGQRKDAKHLFLGDIFIEALYGRAHSKMHIFLEGDISIVNIDDFIISSELDMGVKLLSKSEADRIWEVAFCSANDVPATVAGLLDSHVCPVFSRRWIEQQGLIFEDVFDAERVLRSKHWSKHWHVARCRLEKRKILAKRGTYWHSMLWLKSALTPL